MKDCGLWRISGDGFGQQNVNVVWIDPTEAASVRGFSLCQQFMIIYRIISGCLDI